MTFSATDPNSPRPFRRAKSQPSDCGAGRPEPVDGSLDAGAPGSALTAPSDRPAHYRLSTETWEIILEAYRQGATVPELALQWRVSEHALRKRITVHGATKRDWGDAQALQQAEARREDAQARALLRAEAEAALAEAASPGGAGGGAFLRRRSRSGG